MPLSDAFLNGFAGRISNEDVPMLHKKTYTHVAEWTRDKRILETWLRQRGLSATQIASKNWNTWSTVKTDYYDHNRVPPSNHMSVPLEADDAGWNELLSKYGITDLEEQGRVRSAYGGFRDEYYFSSENVLSSTNKAATGTSEMMDRFIRQFKLDARIGSEYTDIRSDLGKLRGEARYITDETQKTELLKALDSIDEYSHNMQDIDYLDDRPPSPSLSFEHTWEDRPHYEAVDNIKTMEDIQTYITQEEARLASKRMLLPEYLLDPAEAIDAAYAQELQEEMVTRGGFEPAPVMSPEELALSRGYKPIDWSKFKTKFPKGVKGFNKWLGFNPGDQSGFGEATDAEVFHEVFDPDAGPPVIDDDGFRLDEIMDPADIPAGIRNEIRAQEFLGEDLVRELIWENPDASYSELVRKLQNVPENETVRAYSQRVYGRPPAEAFHHVYEMWDQEIDLGNAIRTIQKVFPDDDLTVGDLQHRIWDQRRSGRPLTFDEVGDYFREREMMVL